MKEPNIDSEPVVGEVEVRASPYVNIRDFVLPSVRHRFPKIMMTDDARHLIKLTGSSANLFGPIRHKCWQCHELQYTQCLGWIMPRADERQCWSSGFEAGVLIEKLTTAASAGDNNQSCLLRDKGEHHLFLITEGINGVLDVYYDGAENQWVVEGFWVLNHAQIDDHRTQSWPAETRVFVSW